MDRLDVLGFGQMGDDMRALLPASLLLCVGTAVFGAGVQQAAAPEVTIRELAADPKIMAALVSGIAMALGALSWMFRQLRELSRESAAAAAEPITAELTDREGNTFRRFVERGLDDLMKRFDATDRRFTGIEAQIRSVAEDSREHHKRLDKRIDDIVEGG